MSRDHAELVALLGDYVDDELPVAGRAELHRHLEECDVCLREVEGMLLLRAGVRALPTEIAPPRDLWPDIRSRLMRGEAPRVDEPGVIVADFGAPTRRRAGLWGGLLAASVALVVLSSGLTVYLLRNSAAAAARVVATAAAADSRPVGLAAFQASQVEYRATVAALRAELDARRPALTPETIATIELNLAIIDHAIGEAQAALAADPSNSELPHLLSGVYRKKVELLQDAVRLPTQS